MLTLLAARQRLYAYTRPAAGLLGVSTCWAVDQYAYAPPRTKSIGGDADELAERLCALPLLVVGSAGVAATLTRRGGLTWLSHGYERGAWTLAFGSIAATSLASMLGPTGTCSQNASNENLSDRMLAPASAAALAATAGERLGSIVGRILFPALGGVGVLCACATPSFLVAGSSLAMHLVPSEVQLTSALVPTDPDEIARYAGRVSCALQASALVLLPALHILCPAVYTLSIEATLGVAWLCAAAGFSHLDATVSAENHLPSPEACRNVLLAVGCASWLRTLVKRRPICQF